MKQLYLYIQKHFGPVNIFHQSIQYSAETQLVVVVCVVVIIIVAVAAVFAELSQAPAPVGWLSCIVFALSTHPHE